MDISSAVTQVYRQVREQNLREWQTLYFEREQHVRLCGCAGTDVRWCVSEDMGVLCAVAAQVFGRYVVVFLYFS